MQGGGSLLDFLLASEQTLFRRTQVRQILAFERDLEPARYLADLETLLSDLRVRPHIREAVVRWLATVLDPKFAEWRLVEAYAKAERRDFAALTGPLPRATKYLSRHERGFLFYLESVPEAAALLCSA